jgi:predicted TPR repeat methyltransferase
MDDWKAAAFDARVAALYDEDAPRADTEDCVSLLEELAAGGPVLELAIGTGRIGVPLAARGLRVDGIDSSPHMLDKLRAKGGAQNIATTLGNFADVAVEGTYRLIYVVYNTLPNLGTQDEQVRCFENVAGHLTDDGVSWWKRASWIPSGWPTTTSMWRRSTSGSTRLLWTCPGSTP